MTGALLKQGHRRLPPRFWQISWPYLNQKGHIVPPTVLLAPQRFRQLPTPIISSIFFEIILLKKIAL